MGFNLGGLLASAMKGAGEGGKATAEYGMKLDMQKQLMEAQKDKDLAVDAIRRERDVAQVGTMAAANAAAAPIVAEGEAKALPIKTAAETTAAIDKTKSLSESPEYLEGTKKIQRASKVVEREIATERANAIAGRGTGGGGKANSSENLTLQGAKASAVAAGKDVNFYGGSVKSLNKELKDATSKTRPGLQAQLEQAQAKLKAAEASKAEADKLVKDFTSGRMRTSGTGGQTTGRADRANLDTVLFGDQPTN